MRKVATMNTINKIIPFVTYIEEDECYQMKSGYMDILQIQCKDLANLPKDNIQYDIQTFRKIYLTLAPDIKIVGMNFPTDTTKQKQYFDYKATHTENPYYREYLLSKHEEMEQVEQRFTEREFYIFVWGKDIQDLIQNRSRIYNTLKSNQLISKVEREKKMLILYKLNNKNTSVLGTKYPDIAPDERSIKKKSKDFKKLGYEPTLLKFIQPQGGISFENDDRYITYGDGYEAVLQIYDIPEQLSVHWMRDFTFDGVVTTYDIHTEDTNEVKRNINRSMGEQEDRYEYAKDRTDKRDAQERYNELNNLYEELKSFGEIVKSVKIRMYIADATYYGVEEKVKEIKDKLEGDGYKVSIMLNEQKEDYMAMFQSYTTQQSGIIKRVGKPFMTEQLAMGNPFHFSSLNDVAGAYYGYAPSTGGAVNLDTFCKTKQRLSYNAVCFGGMGAGKSTFLKKNFCDRASRGDFIRGFDVSGEWTDLVKTYGGKIVSLDGSDGILNPLEVLCSADDERQSFTSHLSKVATMYRFLVPQATDEELYLFETELNNIYIKYGLLDPSGTFPLGKITDLPPEKYPILSDIEDMLNEKLEADYNNLDPVQKQIKVEELKKAVKIRDVIHNLCNNYGEIFNGHTTMTDLLNSQIVFFNIKGLAKMTEKVFDAQMFSALSLCYDNCVKVGTLMKNGYEEWQRDHSTGIPWNDIVHFMIYVDEAHRIVNANKLIAVNQLVTYEREARKYFGGILFASQSIRDFVPEGADSIAIQQIKKLFELSQYKYIMKQDANAVSTLREVFHGDLTSGELEDVPRFEAGEVIMVISGYRNIHFNVHLTDSEQLLFSGGV